MLRRSLVLGVLVLAVPVSFLRCEERGSPAKLSMTQIRMAEARVQLPGGSRKVAGYVRYYTVVEVDGKTLVIGMYLDRAMSGPFSMLGGAVRVVASEADLPTVKDGGCSVIHVRFDANLMPLDTPRCNGPT
jgi:hypothetical protein